MGIVVTTPPTEYPVTLTEAKAQCRVDGSAEDTYITGLIAAATDYVEQYTSHSIMEQTLQLSMDAFTDTIMLRRGPVQSVTSVEYYDANGDLQTASSGDYTLDNTHDPAWIVLNSGASWPTTLDGVNAVVIEYVTGFTITPPAIKHAILLLVGDWFRGRENTALGTNQPTEMPHAVTALLANYRSYA